MHISKNTALDIAMAHREIETATELLKQVEEQLKIGGSTDIRDAWGRPAGGLQLGVPADRGHRLFNVPWTLARPIVEAHIAAQRALVSAHSEKARLELAAREPTSKRGDDYVC